MRRYLFASLFTLTVIGLTGQARAQSGTRYIPVPPPLDNRVRLTVSLPADAVLEIEGTRTNQRGAERVFVSPPLPAGKVYVYTLKATWEENGKKVVREKKVDVKANQRLNVDMTKAKVKKPPKQ